MCQDYINRSKQRHVYYTVFHRLSGARSESCGLTFTTLLGAVTWHAIYGHSDKGTDVLDVSKVGEVLQHTSM